jgi:hypothetical protein
MKKNMEGSQDVNQDDNDVQEVKFENPPRKPRMNFSKIDSPKLQEAETMHQDFAEA